MSNVHRLRLTDRIFFINVNLRPRISRFRDSDYPLILNVLHASRERLGFLLCGYVLIPDHWHALIWVRYPLLIGQVLHDVKKITTLRFHALRGSKGPFWQHQFWDRFVRHEREFRQRLEYMHMDPGPSRVGRAAGGLAVVELQQFCFGQGHGGGLPHSD